MVNTLFYGITVISLLIINCAITNAIQRYPLLPKGHSPKLGYSLDGFPVYGPLSDGGLEPTNLDNCNGMEHPTLGYIYYTSFIAPYILGCYRGEISCDNFLPQWRRILDCETSSFANNSAPLLSCSDLGLISGVTVKQIPFSTVEKNIPKNLRCTAYSCPAESPLCWHTNNPIDGTDITNSVTCSEEDTFLHISSIGVPNHNYGAFPMRVSTSVKSYDRKVFDNPNSLSEQHFNWKIPRQPLKKNYMPPSVLNDQNQLPLGPIGFAVNGVALFNPYNADGDDPVAPESDGFEVLDMCFGHPDMHSVYHYHFMPYCLLNILNNNSTGNEIKCKQNFNDLFGFIFA